MSDASIAAIARNLADALRLAAYTREDSAKKAVTGLHMDLVAAVKEERYEEEIRRAAEAAPPHPPG